MINTKIIHQCDKTNSKYNTVNDKLPQASLFDVKTTKMKLELKCEIQQLFRAVSYVNSNGHLMIQTGAAILFIA